MLLIRVGAVGATLLVILMGQEEHVPNLAAQELNREPVQILLLVEELIVLEQAHNPAILNAVL